MPKREVQPTWTPNRTLRIPDDPWIPAKKRAEAEGTTITEVITKYLRRYGHYHGQTRPKEQDNGEDEPE